MPVKKMDFRKIQSGFFISLIILFAVASLFIFRPFLYPMFWASVLAISFYPLYLKLDKHIRFPSLSAGITVLFIIALVIIPLLFVATLLVSQSSSLYEKISNFDVLNGVDTLKQQIGNLPFIGSYVGQLNTTGPEFAKNAASFTSSFLFENFKALTQYSINFFFMSFLMLYTLFYFLRDGKRMLKRLMHLSPLGDKYEEMLYERFTSTARATLKGTFIVGVVQGTLGGIMFWIAGIQGAFVWGVLMSLFSIIPGVGSGLVWLPTAIFMLAIGSTKEGIILLVGGFGVISIIDNFLRPPLVGRDTQMHPLLVLFSTLGGIFAFGISGFIIGPIITALFLAIMSIYDHYYHTELGKN